MVGSCVPVATAAPLATGDHPHVFETLHISHPIRYPFDICRTSKAGPHDSDLLYGVADTTSNIQ